MDISAATNRLRRTFAYSSDTFIPAARNPNVDDSDSDSDAPALDEQEQEDLIRTLAKQNAERNAQFRLLLLSLPALSTIPYLLVLFTSAPNPEGGGRKKSATDVWIAVLALSSLASTAWSLWSLPPGSTGIHTLDAWVASSSLSSSSSSPNSSRRVTIPWQHRSPLAQYLPFLNLALCAVLIIAGFASSARGARHWGHVRLANLPALVYAVVLAAKMLMGSTDPERELGALRYGYKGA
ncbi:hypothetical protein GGR50DRAFT_639029 [Xylaria sp. CBS 124048]|nr:hypothetical protein GGR50DRAFT_639029 [Xylaria sp. CBS 124048]